MIPTILITGFLGAGKTTLLNRLIAYYGAKRTVLLVNEFGQVNIDAQRLVPGDYKTVELNKGSLFCICVRTDFIKEVERITGELKPELLIIEATGMADTSEMENMLSLPVLKDHIDLQANLCVVDAQNFLKVSKFLKAPVSQVEKADLVLVNKIDLVTQDSLQTVVDAVEKISDGAVIVQTSFCDVDLGKIEALARKKPSGAIAPGEGRPDPVVSVTLRATGSCDMEAWNDFTGGLIGTVLRIKGTVNIGQSAFEVDATTDNWSQKLVPVSTGDNRLVVIGKDMDQGALVRSFERLFEGNA